MMKPRRNRQMAIMVERGLYVQRSSSTREAARYLAAYGVPLDVALRVLTTEARRDMRELLAAPPSWRDIILSAGPTFGDQTHFTAS